MGIFPEGGISDDGRLQDGELGVASLLLKVGVPVLPAAIVGTRESLPRGAWLPRRGTLEVAFGPLIHPEEIAAGRSPHEARRLVRDRVMEEIGRLLPERMQASGAPPHEAAGSR